MEIKLIIFDLGGVLTFPKDDNDPHKRIAKKYNISPKDYDTFFYKYFEDYHFNRTLSQYNFWKKTLSQINKNITEVEIQEAIEDFDKNFTKEYNEKMIQLVKKLSNKYKLVLLSNSSREMDKAIFSSEVIKYFDRICLSHFNSKKKPCKKAFFPILEDFDVMPKEVIFVDDKEKNIIGAKNLGINTIHFKNYETTTEELKNLKVI